MSRNAGAAGDLALAAGLALFAAAAWASRPALHALRALAAPRPGAVYAISETGPAPEAPLRWTPARQESPSLDPAATLEGSPAPIAGWEGLLLGRPLDLNQASAEDLEALPRVGPKIARAILELREARGGFRSPEDLLDVRGIGPKTLALLLPLVEVRAQGPKDKTLLAEGQGGAACRAPEPP